MIFLEYPSLIQMARKPSSSCINHNIASFNKELYVTPLNTLNMKINHSYI